MRLKSLEISGFKSFAKKANLQFSTPITGIVGPNGSGKSNVAESFRFVLGEQSIKSLRGRRGEDMIWNGGKDASKGNRASVKLTLDNSRRMFENIDFDEVTVERVVHRDNVNEYLLNGSQVRLKDIVELMARAHIGASGHHIISQGEADRVLSASIRERREMIEDALGLKLYQWKKLESLRKLERTEENMDQVESLRREIAPHIKFLKKQVEKVEKAEELRKELVVLYREYFTCEEYHLKTEKDRLERELAGPQKELSDLDRALEKAKAVLTNGKNKDEKSDEVISLESRLTKVRTDKDLCARRLGRIEGEIAANRRAIEKEQLRMKNEESKTVYLREVEEIVRDIETKGVDTFKSLDDARKIFHEVVSILRSFISRNRSSYDQSLVRDIGQEITTLTKEKVDLENVMNDLVSAERKLSEGYNLLKETIDREKDTNREAEKDVFRIIARQNEVRATVNTLKTAEQSLSHDEDVFKRELGEAGMIVGREATNYDHEHIGDTIPVASREEQSERRRKIERNKVRLEDSGGIGGAEIMKEYRETEERDAFLVKELDDLNKASEELRRLIVELDIRIDTEFKSGISKINSEFKKYFNLMFGGGHAELVIVRETRRKKKSDLGELNDLLVDGVGGIVDGGDMDTDEQLPEGLDVSVSLPRKKIKELMMLSGGERALTSIALIFAISQVNPPPFIILDETDAALDEANSRKYGDMIEDLSKHSQLILITHNRETMSRAGVLYGVTMGNDGASRLLSIQFEEAVKVAK